MTLIPEAAIEPPAGLMLWTAAGLALAWMAVVLWRDCTVFEIDFLALAAVVLNVAVVVSLTEGGPGLGAAAAAGLVAGLVALGCHLARPSGFGRGDIWLYAAIGFVAGPARIVPVFLALGALALPVSAAYSLRRGKRLFRSPFPMALPGMGAAALGLGLRLTDADFEGAPAHAGLASALFWTALAASLLLLLAWRPA